MIRFRTSSWLTVDVSALPISISTSSSRLRRSRVCSSKVLSDTGFPSGKSIELQKFSIDRAAGHYRDRGAKVGTEPRTGGKGVLSPGVFPVPGTGGAIFRMSAFLQLLDLPAHLSNCGRHCRGCLRPAAALSVGVPGWLTAAAQAPAPEQKTGTEAGESDQE